MHAEKRANVTKTNTLRSRIDVLREELAPRTGSPVQVAPVFATTYIKTSMLKTTKPHPKYRVARWSAPRTRRVSTGIQRPNVQFHLRAAPMWTDRVTHFEWYFLSAPRTTVTKRGLAKPRLSLDKTAEGDKPNLSNSRSLPKDKPTQRFEASTLLFVY